MERFKFKDNYTLEFDGNNNLIMSQSNEDIRKSQLIADYLDAPLELRFVNRPSNPAKSLVISAGFRVGIRYRALTKIKYVEDKELIKNKTHRDWNLNTYRYGFYGKIGIGNLAIFGYYNMTPIFRGESGPEGNQMNSLSIGISLGGF